MIDVSIISEVATQGKEFEPGVLSKDGGLEIDWSFITYLTVRIKDNAVTKQHFYCSDRQKMYCYCSAKAIYYKQRTEKRGRSCVEYITVAQAAEQWGISDRRVRILCQQGKIDGVIRKGRD